MKHPGKVAFGVAVTVGFLWWTLADVPFGDVLRAIADGDFVLLGLSIALTTFGFLIRAMRWEIFLRPVQAGTGLHARFQAVSIHFMANNVIPLRVGELARAWVISRLEPVSATAAFGTVVVERFMDGLVLLILLVLPTRSSRFPEVGVLSNGWGALVFRAAVVGLVVVILALVVMAAVPQRFLALAGRAQRLAPPRLREPLMDGLEHFLASIASLRDPKLMTLGLVWSFGFWLLQAASFWGGHASVRDRDWIRLRDLHVVGRGLRCRAARGTRLLRHVPLRRCLRSERRVRCRRRAVARLRLRMALRLVHPDHRDRPLLRLASRSVSGRRRCRGGRSRGARGSAGRGGARGRVTPAAARRATVDAPCKVNLTLRVGGRRLDGFHEIETLFQAVELADRVAVELGGSGIELEVSGADLGSPESNLAYRAAAAFMGALPAVGGVSITLEKRVPAGAGLGGGSSDAAAVLRTLDAITDGAVSGDELHRIGASLGSDVPFFLGASPLAEGRGRGEELNPLAALEPAALVLALPPVHVDTGLAYRALADARTADVQADGRAADVHSTPVFGSPSGRSVPSSWEEVVDGAVNDFEPVIAARFPEVAGSLAALRRAGARVALLSGSGGASFGIFSDVEESARVAERLTRETGWRFLATRTLPAFPDVRAD